MDKRWINLAVIIILIALILLVFFNPFQERLSFAEGKKAVEQAWVESGIALIPENPFVELPKLGLLQARLESLREQFNALREGREKQALLAYLQIQLKLVEALKIYNKLNSDYPVFFGSETSILENCENFAALESISSNAIALNSANKQLVELNSQFINDFPEFAGSVSGLEEAPSIDSNSLNDSVEQLSRICAEVESA